jgi:hypothetical protein
MSRFKQPSYTLAASSGFGRRLMIASESKQIPGSPGGWKSRRPITQNSISGTSPTRPRASKASLATPGWDKGSGSKHVPGDYKTLRRLLLLPRYQLALRNRILGPQSTLSTYRNGLLRLQIDADISLKSPDHPSASSRLVLALEVRLRRRSSLKTTAAAISFIGVRLSRLSC